MNKISERNEQGELRRLAGQPESILFKSRPLPGEKRHQWLQRHPWVVVLHVIKIVDQSCHPPKCVGIALTGEIELKTGERINHWSKIRNDSRKMRSLVHAVALLRQWADERGIVVEDRS